MQLFQAMTVREKIAAWIRKKPFFPYRIKKSLIKRLIPAILDDYPFEQDFFGLVYTGNAANYIDRIVFLCGAYEKFMLFFLEDIVSSLSLGDGIFIDIGANVGNHTLYMSRLMREVHAFEPYDTVLNELQKKIRMNRIKNVYSHRIGLSNQCKILPFYSPQGKNLGTGSFCPEFKDGGQFYKSLPVTTGDLFFRENDIENIKIIKIDVEGHERQVLEGLAKTLSLYRPIILFEMSPETSRCFDNTSKFSERFPINYHFLRFKKADRDSGKYKLAKYMFGQDYKYQDVIAIPDEKYTNLK